MIGKYSVHTTKDLKNENCNSRGYRLVRITKKEEVRGNFEKSFGTRLFNMI